jgi:hypothetical protein
MCTGSSRRAGAVSIKSSSCVNFPHSTDAHLSGFFTTQTAKPHNHVVVNTIVNTVVNTAFFYFEPSPEEEVMKNNQLGIVVRTCSGSFVVPAGNGSFLCVSDLKVSVFLAAEFAARWCSAERRKHRLKINVTASFNKLLRVHRRSTLQRAARSCAVTAACPSSAAA